MSIGTPVFFVLKTVQYYEKCTKVSTISVYYAICTKKRL